MTTYDETGAGGGISGGTATVQGVYLPSTLLFNDVLYPGTLKGVVSTSGIVLLTKQSVPTPSQLVLNSGTTNSNWANPTNAIGFADANYATVRLSTTYSKELRFRTLGLVVPANSTLIALQITAYGFMRAFAGRHFMDLIPNDDNSTYLVEGTEFSGGTATFGNLTDTALQTWGFSDPPTTASLTSDLFGFNYLFAGEVDDRCFIDAFTVIARFETNV
jgi:hypothetical protein